MDLKEKVRNLPSAPGVYLMKDSLGGIIYVGKSKNLKSRVSSYFQNSKSHSPKVVKLVKNIKDFEYILTDTEFEAFMLECKLIKELKPPYNKKMKSPLSYAYIKLDPSEKFASMEVVNETDISSDILYFGPYRSKNTVEKAVQGIKETCKILCSNPAHNGSACLYYSLGSCIGMCLGNASKVQYDAIIDKVVKLLTGMDRSIVDEMSHKMQNAAQNFDFETAAKYRDYIGAVEFLLNSEKVIEFTEGNKNIAILEYLADDTIKFFIVKGSAVISSEKYMLSNYSLEELISILSCSILKSFKNNPSDTSIHVGKTEIDEAQIIYTYLKTSGCKYSIIQNHWLEEEAIPAIGEVIRSLLSLN